MLEFDPSQEKLKNSIKNSLLLIREYDWLINSYVLDFFVDDHWNRLPKSWRDQFETLNPENLSELLNEDKQNTIVWPLSLICLKKLLKYLCISRKKNNFPDNISKNVCLSHPKLKNIFTKCVKPKKRHEIQEISRICHENVQKFNVNYIVDFGAGLGHLARVLSYGYGLKVCCLEMQSDLNEQAKIIDNQLEITASKHLDLNVLKEFQRPNHVTLKLTKDLDLDKFLKIIKNSFEIKENDDKFSFGIIGLHPCGDLATILIDLFLKCKEAKFLNIIGCCYMKLSTRNDLKIGYPLSNYLRNHKISESYLSYESREIACHSNTTYEHRLNTEYENLKVHSFRACLETILIKYWPNLKHSGLKSIKHTKSLTFEEYCQRAVKNLQVQIPDHDIKSNETINNLKQWKLIVIFYTLRLMFAPLIESVLLNDRLLYLIENDCNVSIQAIFDPSISPRNHLTTAIKR